ncbi:MAG: hypothetical protein PUC44_01860 [Eubacteriales bacterium]|nr:hypothetical protein [Eubacteriales bacterium]
MHAQSLIPAYFEAINSDLTYFKDLGADIPYTKSWYYFSFLLYHNRWNDDFTLSDFQDFSSINKYKGFQFTTRSLESTSLTEPAYTDEIGKAGKEQESILEDLLSYCETLDQTVIFVSSPYSISEDDQKVMNRYMQIIQDAGFKTFDFNTEELSNDLGLDWSQDFLDSKHLNYTGAQIFTRYISKYLSKNFDLTDHRGQEGYESWDSSVLSMERKYLKLRTQELISSSETEKTGEASESNG